MAYEVIMVYHLRMPFFIAIFLCFLKKLSDRTWRSGRSLTTSSDFSLKSYHAAFTALFLTLSIISMALAVCIPKKIQRISVFLFRAFILESE